MAKKRGAKQPKNKIYTHIPTGRHFELVKENPVTLVPAYRQRSAFGDARKPTKITFARDYQEVNVS